MFQDRFLIIWGEYFIMQQHYTTHIDNSYPVKITCRTASLSRLRKLRISWFVAGIAFSFGCTSALTPIFNLGYTTAETQALQTTDDALAENLNDNSALETIISSVPEESFSQTIPVILEKNPTENKKDENKPEHADNNGYSKSLDIKIKKGDTLISVLTNAGIPSDEAHNTFDAIRRVFNPRRLDVGKTISLQLGKDNTGGLIVRKLNLPISSISTVELNRTDNDDFKVKKVDVPLTKKIARAGGNIDSSIYQTGADIGVPAAMMNEIVNAYSYDVDFQHDIKKGDSIDVLFERMETPNGATAGNGNLIFAELELGDRTLKIYRYVDKNGNADFYNEKGESIRKALLRTPINGARITSGFGMRNHPISGYTKMHRGVDFGAPIGTPIYAAGDGVVESATVKSGYGNYLKIRHNNKYSSAYAHLSRFAGGVSPGKKVKQGQIVAYVGMTGATTGPHLHYEILANNEQVNPANVKFKTGNSLQGKELANFRSNMSKIEARLASVGRGKTVAMADEPDKNATN